MKTILVTGSAGYVGQVFLRSALEILSPDDYRIVGLDNCMYGQTCYADIIRNPNFIPVFGDVRDDNVYDLLSTKGWDNFDVVIPLACYTGAPICNKFQEDAIRVNYTAVKDIVTRYPNALFIFPNTNSGYGHTDGEKVCTEKTPMTPLTLYAKTKCNAERYIVDNVEKFVIFRLATVFGISPRMRLDLLVNDFVFKAGKDRRLDLYEPEYKRNFVHIEDVASAFLNIIQDDYREGTIGQIFNLGNDALNMTKLQLAEKIGEHVPDLDIQIRKGEDEDKRNYTVSSKKFRTYVDHYPFRDMDEDIKHLLKLYESFGYRQFAGLRNA